MVTSDTSGPVPVARIVGEIDLANATRVREDVLAVAVDAGGLIVDLSEVSYMDSAGVRTLFQLTRMLRQRDQPLVVTVPANSPLRRVLKIASLHEVAAICDDIGSAYKVIASPR